MNARLHAFACAAIWLVVSGCDDPAASTGDGGRRDADAPGLEAGPTSDAALEAGPPHEHDAAADAGQPEDARVPDDAVIMTDAAGAQDAATCEAVAPTECPSPEPTYATVEPIIAARCLSCHDGLGDEWPLISYDHVTAWYAEIRSMLLDCTMPPPDSGIEMPLEERQTILAWLRCGYPE